MNCVALVSICNDGVTSFVLNWSAYICCSKLRAQVENAYTLLSWLLLVQLACHVLQFHENRKTTHRILQGQNSLTNIQGSAPLEPKYLIVPSEVTTGKCCATAIGFHARKRCEDFPTFRTQVVIHLLVPTHGSNQAQNGTSEEECGHKELFVPIA